MRGTRVYSAPICLHVNASATQRFALSYILNDHSEGFCHRYVHGQVCENGSTSQVRRGIAPHLRERKAHAALANDAMPERPQHANENNRNQELKEMHVRNSCTARTYIALTFACMSTRPRHAELRVRTPSPAKDAFGDFTEASFGRTPPQCWASSITENGEKSHVADGPRRP